MGKSTLNLAIFNSDVSFAEDSALFGATFPTRGKWNWFPTCRGRHSMAAGKQSLVSLADVALGTAGPLACQMGWEEDDVDVMLSWITIISCSCNFPIGLANHSF